MRKSNYLMDTRCDRIEFITEQYLQGKSTICPLSFVLCPLQMTNHQ
ncbi:hypothetical protein [Nostoc sp. CHAB 5715]|nr:hypothetical protein [Nostoc sp. CHAB 5715]MCC5622495.1 hypothetical protein [Nostoc sp. CHAB 5715]